MTRLQDSESFKLMPTIICSSLSTNAAEGVEGSQLRAHRLTEQFIEPLVALPSYLCPRRSVYGQVDFRVIIMANSE
jgi:hypothetical protein